MSNRKPSPLSAFQSAISASKERAMVKKVQEALDADPEVAIKAIIQLLKDHGQPNISAASNPQLLNEVHRRLILAPVTDA